MFLAEFAPKSDSTPSVFGFLIGRGPGPGMFGDPIQCVRFIPATYREPSEVAIDYPEDHVSE